jgi:hypothetical protein
MSGLFTDGEMSVRVRATKWFNFPSCVFLRATGIEDRLDIEALQQAAPCNVADELLDRDAAFTRRTFDWSTSARGAPNLEAAHAFGQ